MQGSIEREKMIPPWMGLRREGMRVAYTGADIHSRHRNCFHGRNRKKSLRDHKIGK